MSILDDAIREHLELKRAHGADEAELKKLEDEAFGPPQRPNEGDVLAEAPTEFLSAPEAPEGVEGRREPNIADLQEPPPPEPPAQAEAEAPAVEEQPAMEHRAVPEAPQPSEEPVADAGPNTEERHAIAEEPTQFFDVEAEMGAEEVGVPPEAASQPDAPPKATEPPPTEPPAASQPAAPPEPAPEDEEDEEFWGEQRLSEELDRALEAPLTDEHELEEEDSGEEDSEEEEPEAGAEKVYDPDTGHDDVLEDTPEFLEDAPDDDELWFEQRPPKDFDFDD